MDDLLDMLKAVDELDLLIACVRGEAEGEPFMGKLAVACVIRNRLLDDRWPNTYHGVMLQKWQFSCFIPKYFRESTLKHEWSRPFYRECRYAAFGVYSDWVRDISGGANHYYATWIPEPDWAQGKDPVFRMDKHLFYKL